MQLTLGRLQQLTHTIRTGPAEHARLHRELASANDRALLAERRAAELAAAGTSAADLLREAQEQAATLVAEAERDAQARRAAAETYAQARRAAAETDAQAVRAAAETDAQARRAAAETDAQAVRAAAETDAQALRQAARTDTAAARNRVEGGPPLAEASPAGSTSLADAPAGSTPLADAPTDTIPRYGVVPSGSSLAGSARSGSARSGSVQRRTALIGLPLAALAAVLAFAALHRGSPQAARPAAAAAPAAAGTAVSDPGAAAAVPALGRPVAVPVQAGETTASLIAALAPHPDRAGRDGRALLGALRSLDRLKGPGRQNRALGLANDVERAAGQGRISPEAAQRVRPVLLHEATPSDVAGLVAMLKVHAQAAGRGGPKVLTELSALGSPSPPDPRRAAALADEVADGPGRGTMTTGFRAVALPVLDRAAGR